MSGDAVAGRAATIWTEKALWVAVVAFVLGAVALGAHMKAVPFFCFAVALIAGSVVLSHRDGAVGRFFDWPVGTIAAGVLGLVWPGAAGLGVLLLVVGVVGLLIRRGAFSPRSR